MRIFLPVYLLFTCGIIFAQDDARYQLLWEVTGKKLRKPSYVFGSMHSNDPRLFQFPDSLYIAFAKADAVVLETDVSALFDEYDVRLDEFNLEILAKNKPYTNSREATRTTYGSEDGRPQFLDAYFQQTGYCAGKKFFPLEGVDDQLEASSKLEEMTAGSAVKNYFFSKETFVQFYLQGDIATLSKMLKKQLGDIPGAYEALITNRNLVMANGLDTLMRKQSVFCAIGSGHLYGTDGVLHLLRSKGYNVRAVTATYSEQGNAARKLVNSWRKYEIRNESLKFSIDLGGKPVEFTGDNYRFIYQELGQGNTFELKVYPTDKEAADYAADFVTNKFTAPVTGKYAGADYIEGHFFDPWKGLQWKRIIVRGTNTYELVCYGGNKFMHSDRPKKYFSALQLF